jgi:predicted glycosyltransferase
VQERALIPAGGWGYTSYACALAQGLHEKASLSFLAFEGDATKIVRGFKDVEKIWIDMTNSPHVLFFEPLIRMLKKEGAEFLITARPYQQTIELLKQKKLNYKIIGKHYGKSKFRKASGLFFRSFLLWKEIMKQKSRISFSISHGSPYCSIASNFAGIYNLWTLDGDKAKDVIIPGVKFANKVIIPEIVPKENYVKMGAKEEKIIQYPGLKEEVYLWNFKPNKRYLEEIGLETDKPVILMRPEASKAVYIKETEFLIPLIETLKEDYFIILIPRTLDQKVAYKKIFGNSIFIPSEALDGPNVIANSSIVISAGGTINREAVVLEKKVISTFREELLTVDKWLIENKFMLHNLNPGKEFVDDVINGGIKTRKYARSNKAFKFFSELMRSIEIN